MNKTINGTDKVIKTITIYQTTDYGKDGDLTNFGKFKMLETNRVVDELHAHFLQRQMEKKGNLMDKFPAEVSESGEILDGQHRLIAVRARGEPFSYLITNGNIDTIIARNNGSKNWGWRDYIHTWATRGNESYIRLAKLVELYPWISFSVLGLTTMKVIDRNFNRKLKIKEIFNEGEIQVSAEDFANAQKHLAMIQDLMEVSSVKERYFIEACYQLIRLPKYIHETMLTKLQQYGDFNRCYTLGDYLIALEEIWKM